MMIIVATSVGHLHPLLIQIRPGPGRAPPDVDLVSGVDPHATTEPVHEQEVPVLMVLVFTHCLKFNQILFHLYVVHSNLI